MSPARIARRCRPRQRLESDRRKRRPGRVAQPVDLETGDLEQRRVVEQCAHLVDVVRSASAKRSLSSATIAGSALGCTSSRTTGSKRRCCSSARQARACSRRRRRARPPRHDRPETGFRSRSPSPGRASARSRRSPGRDSRKPGPTDATPARRRSHCGSSLGTFTRTSTDSPVTGSAETERPRGREVRHVRERMRCVEAERRQHRRDLRVEDTSTPRPLLVGEVVPGDQMDAMLGKPRTEHLACSSAACSCEHRTVIVSRARAAARALLCGDGCVSPASAGSGRSAS